MKETTQKLLDWHQANPRDLPWKQHRDPYKIWISEIILQQTRVQQGRAYYLRFIERFPDVRSLAIATEDEVLHVWKGLGYYSRARNAHRTAQHIWSEHGGCFPETYEGLLALPGIGPYTAAAIASFAFGGAHVVVDGNVIRVVTRLYNLHGDVGKSTTQKEIHRYAQTLLSDADPAIFNQAIMDFGALQCIPRNPDCANCALNGQCMAHYKKTVHLLPVKSRAKPKKERFFHYLVVHYQDRVGWCRRENKDIWQGLYEFVLLERPTAQPIEPTAITETLSIRDGWQLRQTKGWYRQVLSHQIIHALFYEIDMDVTAANNFPFRLVERENLSNFAVPKIVEEYIRDQSISLF